MQFKNLSLLLALGSYAFAQEGNNTESMSLNETLAGNEDLSELANLLSNYPDLVETLSSAENITILAPNNEAISMLTESAGDMLEDDDFVTALLTYHVLNGTYPSSAVTNMSQFIPTLLTEGMYANVSGGQVVECIQVGEDVVFYSGLLQNSTVTTADTNFTGGTIHIIDNVLTLPMSVVETASAANLSSLNGAVNSTNLVETVNQTPNITVFAPTNMAFQGISSALEELSEEDLANILSYHIINGTVGYSTMLEDGATLEAANGGDITITIDDDGNVFANQALVVTPNVLVANGVVHVIDQVLNPENTDGPEEDASEGQPAFSGASTGTEAPFTSGQPTPSATVGGGSGPAQTTASGGDGEDSDSTEGAAMPMMTGSVGMGALLGAGAAVFFGN